MYKQDLVLNNLQGLTCHKSQLTNSLSHTNPGNNAKFTSNSFATMTLKLSQFHQEVTNLVIRCREVCFLRIALRNLHIKQIQYIWKK